MTKFPITSQQQVCLLTHSFFIILVFLCLSSTPALACNCGEGGYQIGTPGQHSEEILLTDTDMYQDHPNGLVDGCVAVYGTLIINVDYTFDNATLNMNTLTAIVVGLYDRLTIVNQTTIAGCEEMWRGIRLQFESELDMENSTIRDAYHAVTAENDSSVRIEGNIFDNNNVGFYVPPNQLGFKNNIAKLAGGYSFFSDNLFTSTTTMLPPYSSSSGPVAGIVLNDTQAFNLGHYANNSVKNYFSNLQSGLLVYSVLDGWFGGLEIQNIRDYGIFVMANTNEVDIHSNAIRDVNFGIVGDAVNEYSVQDNIIKDCRNAAIAITNSGDQNIRITDNEIVTGAASADLSDEPNGIDISFSTVVEGKEITVSSNSIKVAETGIAVLSTSGKVSVVDNTIRHTYVGNTNGIGVSVVSSEGEIKVKGNVVKKTTASNIAAGISISVSQGVQVIENAIQGDYTYGIICLESTNTSFCCNQLDGSNFGMTFWGLCADSQLKNTIFGKHNTALFYYDALTGPQVNNGNDWSNANTVTDAFFVEVNYPFTSSLFFTDPALIPAGYTKIIPAEGWFTFQGIDPTCGSELNCGIDPYELIVDNDPGRMLTSEDLLALESPKSDELSTQVRQWEHQRYLYAKLSENPSLITVNTAVNQFYAAAQAGTLGAFHDLEMGIRALTSPPVTLKTAAERIMDQIRVLGKELSGLRNVRLETEEQASASFSQPEETLRTELEIAQQEWAILKAQIQSWRTGQVKSLQQQLASLSVETDVQQNLKDYYHIYLQSVVLKQQLTAEQHTELLALAEQCPNVSGNAVLKARALCHKFASNWQWDWEECRQEGWKAKLALPHIDEGAKKMEQVRLFPNPANGQFTLNLDEAMSSDGQILVYTVNGKTVHHQILTEGMTQANVDVSHLPNGIYTVVIMEREQRRATLRLTLTK